MPQTSSSSADKRLFIGSVIIFVLTCLAAFVVLRPRDDTPSALPTGTQEPLVARETVAANLTQLPQATPLSGEMAIKVDALEALIAACPDYTETRRTQSQQHIAWLRQPALLSQEMIIAVGSNPTAGLLRGLGTYALSDWGLKDQAAESCLRPIGQQINVLLLEAGGEAIAAFEE
jgi:hypothetical protein